MLVTAPDSANLRAFALWTFTAAVRSIVDSPLPILFYDAQCLLCQQCRDWLASTGCEAFVIADSNDKLLARRLGVSDLKQLDQRMCLLLADGSTLWGYDALVGLAGQSPAAKSVAPLLRSTPVRAIGRWLYDQIATHRQCAGTTAFADKWVASCGSDAGARSERPKKTDSFPRRPSTHARGCYHSPRAQ
jgi:predicted DCC family thiol-disulfide oxidoreductase YuxK